MKRILKITFILFISLYSLLSTLYSYPQNIEELIDQFKQATEIQRLQMQKEYFAKSISAKARISNVEEYNFFDEKKSLVNKYYRIITDEQKTNHNTLYQVIFLTKDANSVKDLAKGQIIEKNGKIIRLLDERLNISLWLYDAQITPEEKELFAQ